MMLQGWLAVTGTAVSIGLGLIFLAAGLTKYRYRALLPGVIANYRLLPEALVAPAAMLLPFAEMALGLLLVSGLAPLPVVTAAIALLGLFAAAMATNIARGRRNITCGCGRPELKQTLSWALVWRNLGLGTLLLLRLIPAPVLSPFDLVTAGAAGLSAYLLYELLGAVHALTASPLAASRR